MDQVKQFIQAREYLIAKLPGSIETFLTEMYDPFNRHIVIKQTTDILMNQVGEMFPMIPPDHLPKIRFKIHEEYKEIEVGVQYFYNIQNGLTYLGTTNIDTENFDFYVRPSYDPQFDYRLISRFGHEQDDFISGTKTAEAEYYLGQRTPLSFAYSLALEDGFIG
jgi:hypothetical protein